ncbi:alcohol dehydrogenase catalytic domain-containing protein [bacterium]|nr:alcohol dehydrogenase catalytic domain-containing protein [bacterium]
MKAAVYEGPKRIILKEVPDPEIKPGEVLVKIKACAICGSDLRIYNQGHKLITPPRITGHEIAGKIAETGKEISGFKNGRKRKLCFYKG